MRRIAAIAEMENLPCQEMAADRKQTLSRAGYTEIQQEQEKHRG
jgi:hypothetical protein